MSLKSENRKEYLAWVGLRSRCLNENNKNYKNYGGRGISVCEEWKNSFESFFNYIGKSPGNGYSIDRINVNGNYCPGNVKWSTDYEQVNNRRNTVNITIDGVTKNAYEWSLHEECTVSYQEITRRFKLGYSHDYCVFAPVKTKDQRKEMSRCKIIYPFGERMNLRVASKEFNVNYSTVVARYNKYHNIKSDEFIVLGERS